MSFLKIWVHLVFSTKNRQPLLPTAVRYKLQKHIIANCRDKGIFLKIINGHVDHIHCLISLGKDQSIAKVAQLIKGESSFWMNREGLTETVFGWQDDYFAVSVSESQVPVVVNYIHNQEKHHQRKKFEDEIQEFLNVYGWTTVR